MKERKKITLVLWMEAVFGSMHLIKQYEGSPLSTEAS